MRARATNRTKAIEAPAPGWTRAAILLALLISTFWATALAAQQELTLADAIRIARDNNPTYLSRENDQGAADWGVREAYGSLLPSVNATGQVSFREAGVERLGTQSFSAGSTDYYQSFYSLGFNWRLDGNTIYGIPSARAASAATEAGIRAAAFDLRNRVTLQYMAVLRARDAENVARETYERAIENYELVSGRVESGFAAGTDRTQAEVERGRAEVALLQAEQLTRTERARLVEQLGIVPEGSFVLTDQFEVFAPEWELEALIRDAMRAHPSLRSFTATAEAQGAQVRQAQSAYLPSLSFSTNLSGFAQKVLNEDYLISQNRRGYEGAMNSCMQSNALADAIPDGGSLWQRQDCSQFAFTNDIEQAILANNTLAYEKNPVQLNLTLSVPVFSGFSRQRQVEQAHAAARDADLSLRAEELRLRTAITQGLDNVNSAWRSVQIEERNLELATLQLDQARQRYQVGNTSILELMDAETSLETAQRDYLNAVYSFHQWLVGLEAATGRSLRPEMGGVDDDGDGAEG